MLQIEVNNVHRFYTRSQSNITAGERQTPALDGANLEVEDGEFLSIVGPSGCGKTTLLRCIAGFETPDIGSISIAEQLVAADGSSLVPAAKRAVGYVPQDGALFPHLTVQKNVEFGLRHIPRRQRKKLARESLELVGLEHFARRRPHQLSGGQQQRVALARALAPQPNVVVLDEPFSALDAYLRESLRMDVRRILSEAHATALFVTHDQEEALSLGDRVAAMRDGKIIQAGSPRDIYSRPNDLQLATFFGDAIVLEGRLSHTTDGRQIVDCAFGSLPVDPGSPITETYDGLCRVMIRPEQIHIAADSQQPGMAGTLQDVTYYGHDSLLRVHVPELGRIVSSRILAEHDLHSGDPVSVAVDQAVCVYPTNTDTLSTV